MHNFKLFVVVFPVTAIFLLPGCSSLEVYCDRTSGSVTKKVALAIVKLNHPLYPAEGICADLLGGE